MAKLSSGNSIKFPFYARASLVIVGLFVFIHMMAVGRAIIVPLLFATVLSILLSTIVDFLEKKKVNRVLAISVALLVMILIGVLLFMWILSQANLFIDALPQFNEKFDVLQKDFAQWFSEHFGVGARKTTEWITSARKDLTTMSNDRIGDTISTIGNAIIVAILIPVYVFLVLFYQPLIIDFIHRSVGESYTKDVSIVLNQSKTLLKSYFTGLMIELIIVAVLNSIGLLLLGVQYAILIGILGALLNMIPYIGGIITLGMSMLMALLSGPPSVAIYTALVFFLIQIIDNYFLIPKIVGSKVKANALVAVVVTIAGGAIWGIAGMFLAIPLTAILKVIFDRIDHLEPLGFLLGDTMPPMVRIKLWARKRPKEIS